MVYVVSLLTNVLLDGAVDCSPIGLFDSESGRALIKTRLLQAFRTRLTMARDTLIAIHIAMRLAPEV